MADRAPAVEVDDVPPVSIARAWLPGVRVRPDPPFEPIGLEQPSRGPAPTREDDPGVRAEVRNRRHDRPVGDVRDLPEGGCELALKVGRPVRQERLVPDGSVGAILLEDRADGPGHPERAEDAL